MQKPVPQITEIQIPERGKQPGKAAVYPMSFWKTLDIFLPRRWQNLGKCHFVSAVLRSDSDLFKYC